MLQSAGPNRGFTLIELMVTVAILAILLTIGVPSMTSFFDRQKVVAAAEALYSALQETKSEAISRSQTVRFVHNLGSSEYAISTVATTACSASSLNGCTISIGGAAVVNKFNNVVFDDVTITEPTTSVDFDGIRGGVSAKSTYVIESPNALIVKINVTVLGMISICSNDIGSYKSCS